MPLDLLRVVLDRAGRLIEPEAMALRRYAYRPAQGRAAADRRGWRLVVSDGQRQGELLADHGPALPNPGLGGVSFGEEFGVATEGLRQYGVLYSGGYQPEDEPIIRKHGYLPRHLPETIHACRVVDMGHPPAVDELVLDALHLLGLNLVYGRESPPLTRGDVPRWPEARPLFESSRAEDAAWMMLLWGAAVERAGRPGRREEHPDT